MKKVLVLVAVVISASFASCKKDYVCKCTYSYGGTTESYSQAVGKTTKKKAKDACSTWATQTESTCSAEKA